MELYTGGLTKGRMYRADETEGVTNKTAKTRVLDEGKRSYTGYSSSFVVPVENAWCICEVT
jgi:hypothetical protein